MTTPSIDITGIQQGNRRAIARGISLLENQPVIAALPGPSRRIPIIGITGPPGAGKSTLSDQLIQSLVDRQAKVAVLCVDPSSPFHAGALLGDRLRMNRWYQHPDVYIRSLSSRGSSGGLHPRLPEITALLQLAPFDYILVETVGIGQSEVAIATLADVCLLVLVPEAGDDIQALKSGIMEVADFFVVNKADRPGAPALKSALEGAIRLHPDASQPTTPVLLVSALQQTGIAELLNAITVQLAAPRQKDPRLLAGIAWQMIAQRRLFPLTVAQLAEDIRNEQQTGPFSLSSFLLRYSR